MERGDNSRARVEMRRERKWMDESEDGGDDREENGKWKVVRRGGCRKVRGKLREEGATDDVPAFFP